MSLKFNPTEMQMMVLHKLKAGAKTRDELMGELGIGSPETLYGKKDSRGRRLGGLTELLDRRIVLNDRRRGGYFLADQDG